MSDIYTVNHIYGGNKIIIELIHYNTTDDNKDDPFDIAEIYIVREKTEKTEEEKMDAVKIYGDNNKRIKVEVLCKK